jgi:hypothetical protein
MEAWTLLDRESQLYIAEDNKDADGSMDSVNIMVAAGGIYLHV